MGGYGFDHVDDIDDEYEAHYDNDGSQYEPVDAGLAEPFTASDKAVQFITDDHGTLWVPKKGIHENSEVWKAGQPKGRLVLKAWCAWKKGIG